MIHLNPAETGFSVTHCPDPVPMRRICQTVRTPVQLFYKDGNLVPTQVILDNTSWLRQSLLTRIFSSLRLASEHSVHFFSLD